MSLVRCPWAAGHWASPGPALPFNDSASRSKPRLPATSIAQHDDPSYLTLPWYWVPEEEVEARLAGRWDRGWLLGWRDITNTTNERTVIASVLPRAGVGNKIPLVLPAYSHAAVVASLTAGLC